MTARGKRVLVVEDEALVSMLIEDFLHDIGCEVVGTAATLEDALAKSSALDLDAAILDINLNGTLSYPVAQILASRHIPFLFATGYGLAGLPVDLEHVPVLSKPFGIDQFEALLERVMMETG
jgi:CheY-like chemotaxis protein